MTRPRSALVSLLDTPWYQTNKGTPIKTKGKKQRDTHLLLRNAAFRRLPKKPLPLVDVPHLLAYTACMSPPGATP